VWASFFVWLNRWKGKPSGSLACAGKQQLRFYWSCSYFPSNEWSIHIFARFLIRQTPFIKQCLPQNDNSFINYDYDSLINMRVLVFHDRVLVLPLLFSCCLVEVKMYSCYKSKRTSMFPYNIKVCLDIIHKTSFIRYVYKLYNITTLMSYNNYFWRNC